MNPQNDSEEEPRTAILQEAQEKPDGLELMREVPRRSSSRRKLKWQDT